MRYNVLAVRTHGLGLSYVPFYTTQASALRMKSAGHGLPALQCCVMLPWGLLSHWAASICRQPQRPSWLHLRHARAGACIPTSMRACHVPSLPTVHFYMAACSCTTRTQCTRFCPAPQNLCASLPLQAHTTPAAHTRIASHIVATLQCAAIPSRAA